VQGERRRSLVVAVLAAASSASIVAPALGSSAIQPAYEPGQLNPRTEPPGGAPAPDELRWNSPHECNAKRFRGRPGTRRLYAFIEYWWPQVEFWGYGSRPCRDSLHDEGRAVDVHLDVRLKKDRRAARQIKRFLLRSDSDGEIWAMARRFGIQEVIWNCHIWTSTYASDGWRHYSTCDGPSANYTTKHKNHIHIGQSWRGARKQTTAYSGYSPCDKCGAGAESSAAERAMFDALPHESPLADVTGNPVAQSRR